LKAGAGAEMGPLDRGDVVYIEIPGVGLHPATIVSRQESIAIRSDVTVALITSSIRGLPAEVPVNSDDGLEHASVINCDQLWTLPKRAVVKRVRPLRYEKMRRLDNALAIALGLPRP
jgi:mRNA interferase MazF